MGVQVIVNQFVHRHAVHLQYHHPHHRLGFIITRHQKQAYLEYLVKRVHRDLMVLQDLLVIQVHKDLLDHQDGQVRLLDHKEKMDLKDHLDHKDFLDLQVHQGQLDSKEHKGYKGHRLHLHHHHHAQGHAQLLVRGTATRLVVPQGERGCLF